MSPALEKSYLSIDYCNNHTNYHETVLLSGRSCFRSLIPRYLGGKISYPGCSMSGALSSDQLGRLAGALSEESLDELLMDQGTASSGGDNLSAVPPPEDCPSLEEDCPPAEEDIPPHEEDCPRLLPPGGSETPSESAASEAALATSVEAGDMLPMAVPTTASSSSD